MRVSRCLLVSVFSSASVERTGKVQELVCALDIGVCGVGYVSLACMCLLASGCSHDLVTM